jgi:hypothetical protein
MAKPSAAVMVIGLLISLRWRKMTRGGGIVDGPNSQDQRHFRCFCLHDLYACLDRLVPCTEYIPVEGGIYVWQLNIYITDNVSFSKRLYASQIIAISKCWSTFL